MRLIALVIAALTLSTAARADDYAQFVGDWVGNSKAPNDIAHLVITHPGPVAIAKISVFCPPSICDGVVSKVNLLPFGDIHLADVRAWYEERTRAAGLEHVEPLWGDSPRALIREFIAIGGRAVLTCVETAKLDESWLGRIIDDAFVSDVERTGIDPCGENGEYHSFAFSGPFFEEPVAWRYGERRHDGRFAQVEVLAATAATRP